MKKSYPFFAREGWPFIAGSLAISIAITFVWGWFWASPWWLVTIFCIQFFRDPTRKLEAGPNDVVCPADGKVIFVGKEEVAKKKFKVKDMQSGKEEFLSDKMLIKKLS